MVLELVIHTKRGIELTSQEVTHGAETQAECAERGEGSRHEDDGGFWGTMTLAVPVMLLSSMQSLGSSWGWRAGQGRPGAWVGVAWPQQGLWGGERWPAPPLLGAAELQRAASLRPDQPDNPSRSFPALLPTVTRVVARLLPVQVMVWIHGGGLVVGGASAYDGLALSAHENVVVVTIQYRLGLWGFFR